MAMKRVSHVLRSDGLSPQQEMDAFLFGRDLLFNDWFFLEAFLLPSGDSCDRFLLLDFPERYVRHSFPHRRQHQIYL